MKCLGQDNVRLRPENVRNIFERCSWCDKVSSRFNGKVLSEGILKERISSIIESHGICRTCYDKEIDDTKRRSTIPPSKPISISPRANALNVLLELVA